MKDLIAAAFTAGLFMGLCVAGLDALEYETTGECKDCVLLSYND